MDLTARVRGTLYLNNVAGLCARIDVIYGSPSGDLDEEHGGRACAPDNSLHAATIDMAPYTSDKIDRIIVTLQTQSSDGSWRDNPAYYALDDAFIDALY